MGKKEPRRLEPLIVAARQAARDIPPDLAQRACRAFGRRAHLCIQAKGGSFKGKRLAGEDEPLLGNEARSGGDHEGREP